MKTSDQSAQIDLLRKKLRIMEIEVEAYRDMGGLAVKGASRSALLNRLLEFALKAVDAASGALYSVDERGVLAPDAGKGGARRKGRGPGAAAGGDGAGARGGAVGVPLLREKTVRGVITAPGQGREPFTDADLKVLASLANHLNI